MKNKLTVAALAIIAVTFAVGPMHAQASHPQHTATVPFAFSVGGVRFPAGTYTITEFGNRMQVKAVDGSKSAFVTALVQETRRPADSSALRFENQDEGLILSNIYFAGTQESLQLLNKKARAASRVH
jgi:hypothetical protein